MSDAPDAYAWTGDEMRGTRISLAIAGISLIVSLAAFFLIKEWRADRNIVSALAGLLFPPAVLLLVALWRATPGFALGVGRALCSSVGLVIGLSLVSPYCYGVNVLPFAGVGMILGWSALTGLILIILFVLHWIAMQRAADLARSLPSRRGYNLGFLMVVGYAGLYVVGLLIRYI